MLSPDTPGRAADRRSRAMAARAGAGRRTDATPRLNAGAAWVDLQALLEHVDLATTQIDTHMDQDRMAAVVNTL